VRQKKVKSGISAILKVALGGTFCESATFYEACTRPIIVLGVCDYGRLLTRPKLHTDEYNLYGAYNTLYLTSEKNFLVQVSDSLHICHHKFIIALQFHRPDVPLLLLLPCAPNWHTIDS
jgi:hypothetical protein